MQLPLDLLETLAGISGFSKESFEAVHADGAQVTSIRCNPFRRSVTGAAWEPENMSLSGRIPWCNTGYYLSERPSFTLDPFFHAGCYYVQEASSMFLEQIVQTVYKDHAQQPYRVLDLCAAPGGKTTHLSTLFPNGLIVANEVIKTRSGILTENAIRWGKENIVVTSNDAADFQRLPSYFDMIVVDAPCSGSGMFRKDPEAIGEWSLQNVDHCSKRQQRILEDVWPTLKENGVLIYATCSYSQKENEDIADWIQQHFSVENIPVSTPPGSGIVETSSVEYNAKGYRFYPDKVKGEGLFMTCFRKTAAEPEPVRKGKKLQSITSGEKKVMSAWLANPDNFLFLPLAPDEIIAIPAQWAEDIAILMGALYVRKAGIKAGKVIRDELIPDHELAMSELLQENISNMELNKEAALQYLRKLDIPPNPAVKGWALVSFAGFRLGWIKALSNRVNNYYPQRFRILKH